MYELGQLVCQNVQIVAHLPWRRTFALLAPTQSHILVVHALSLATYTTY